MIDRLMSLLVAVSLALLVWLYARSREQEVLDNVTVPVQVSVVPRQADHYHLELPGPAQVVVSFSGPPVRIRELQGMLQRRELHVTKTITVPGPRLSESRTVLNVDHNRSRTQAAQLGTGELWKSLSIASAPVVRTGRSSRR